MKKDIKFIRTQTNCIVNLQNITKIYVTSNSSDTIWILRAEHNFMNEDLGSSKRS
jgi:DNA-binding LytR/AlgR family response regulator